MTNVAWVTGGSKGIGLACARKLAENDWHVAISGRHERDLLTASNALKQAGFNVLPCVCDVTDPDSVQTASRIITDNFGESISLLINNAGLSPFSTFTETTVEEFDNVLNTNLTGSFLCAKAVLPEMYQLGEGIIVQILSISSIKAFKGGAAYNASKFAALGFTNALREEARKQGVKVIAVLPGATETDIWSAEDRKTFHERMMQPEDIAEAIYHAITLPTRALIEEIIIRPIQGDL